MELFKFYVSTLGEYKEWYYPINYFSSFAIKHNFLGFTFNNTDNIWGEFRTLDLSKAEIETDSKTKSKQERKIVRFVFENIKLITDIQSVYKIKT